MIRPMPGDSRPIYVLQGTDSFLRDEHRRRLLADLIEDADPQTCVASFDADVELAAVLDELRTLPFLAPRRVVIVRDADAFVSAYRDPLERYLESPAPSGVLVLTVSSWPSTTKLYKVVARIGKVLDCTEPAKEALPRRIADFAARRGKTVARDAAELLAEWIGADLGTLDGEIEKLSLFVGERPEIAAADVSALVASSTEAGPFELTNAIIAGDSAAALKALGAMLTLRREEFRVLGLLGLHLRKALLAQQLRVSGGNPETVLPHNIPFPAKKAYLAMLQRRSLRRLRGDFRRLLSADLGMKSGAETLAAMQELVVALCV